MNEKTTMPEGKKPSRKIAVKQQSKKTATTDKMAKALIAMDITKKADKEKAEKEKAEKEKANKQAMKSANMTTAYALVNQPRGKGLFTYMLAVLSYNGAFTPARKAIPKGNLINFFRTGSVYRHHRENGNFEETKDGKIRLTVTGWNYFHGRLTGSNVGQEVDKPEMETILQALKTGKMPAKTPRFPQEERFREIGIIKA